MKKKTVLFLISCFLLVAQAYSEHSSAAVYRQIKDICHPTIQDYLLVQDYLTNGKREGLEKLKDVEPRFRNLKIIGSGADEKPRSGIIPVNSTIEEKENCVVLFASFNQHFPDGLRRIIHHVQKSDYKGHILYHLGGWPDLEGGSLVLAHVPGAYKVCAIKEAQKLGYKRILWLDASVFPLVSLNTIFKMIEQKGYFTVGNYHSVGEYCNSQAAEYFGYTLEETNRILSCRGTFLGVDITKEPGQKIVDAIYKAAQDENAFFSARYDQTVLSLVLHKFHYLDYPDRSKVVDFSSKNARPDSLFAIEWSFVHDKK